MDIYPVFDGLCRRLFGRSGYGVHSPFVFDLITAVIEEEKKYYSYKMFHDVRMQLQRELGGKAVAGRKRFCFSERECRFLFRLANRFQPRQFFVAGSDWGLIPLCLTAYAHGTHCTVYEADDSVAREYAVRYARGTVESAGDLSAVLDSDKSFDMIVWGMPGAGASFDFRIFERLLPHIHVGSVMAIAGIRASASGKDVWTAICDCPAASVTVDMGRLGLVFFNHKLHRRTYRASLL